MCKKTLSGLNNAKVKYNKDCKFFFYTATP